MEVVTYTHIHVLVDRLCELHYFPNGNSMRETNENLQRNISPAHMCVPTDDITKVKMELLRAIDS